MVFQLLFIFDKDISVDTYVYILLVDTLIWSLEWSSGEIIFLLSFSPYEKSVNKLKNSHSYKYIVNIL